MGSTAALAQQINVPFSELLTYRWGEAMPLEDILLRAVDLVTDELLSIRQTAWQSMALPR